jgi:hypothetical protein
MTDVIEEGDARRASPMSAGAIEAIFRPQSQVGKGYSRCDNTYGARSLRAWRTAAKRVLSTLRKVRKASLSAMNDSGRIHSS